ncbi:MAG TPA: DUF5916 domain-containing protein [Hyphomicrobiales bacterium]|nr:DUF5916 domain-containing protein [Hyphomicrobiales bacterium]
MPVRPSLFQRLLAAALLFGALALNTAHAADYRIPKSATTPTIDGVITPDEWQGALSVRLTNETRPAQNQPAPVATEALLMEDGENFLVAFIAEDPEPGKIRAFYRDRDRSFQDDFVGVVLDTFNDERRAFEFFVNPLGIQMDLIQDDVSGNEDASWNAIWDSAGRITDTGFIVEMKIPLKQIRIASGLELQTWGIDLLRFYPRDVRHRISNNQWNYDTSCYLCQLQKAEGFPDLQQSTNLQLIPTVTAQLNENRPNPATDAWTRKDLKTAAGLDLRWGLDADTVLNATLNPDFSQVEADNLELDTNNTYTLFFQERREFFLDGAEYFNTFENLVHTRNIQDPDYGLKLTGKRGAHTYAVLAANDQRTAFIVPGNQGSRVATLNDTGSDNLALRYRYDYGRNLTLGTLLTHREGGDYANTLLDADINWRLGASDRIRAQVMVTDTDNPLAIQQQYQLAPTQSDRAWRAEYNHAGEHFGLNLRSFGYGEDYRADLGFATKADYVETNLNPSYRWLPGTGHFFNQFGVFGVLVQVDDVEGDRLQDSRRLGAWADGHLQSYVEVSVYQGERFYDNRFFTDDGINLFSSIKPWGGAEFRLDANRSRTVDFANSRPGDSLTLKPGLTLQLGRHLQAQLNHHYQRFDVDEGRLFETNLSDLRLTWQFSARSFVRAVLLYGDTTRAAQLYRSAMDATSKSLATQLLYSYRLNAQTRFFIGYGDNAIQNGNLTELAAVNRSVFAKFAYAWQY